MIGGIFLYTWFCFSYSKRENETVKEEFEREFGGNDASKTGTILRNISLIISGLVLLVVGSKWLVNSSIAFARHFGISELVIALTIVAAGTSLRLDVQAASRSGGGSGTVNLLQWGPVSPIVSREPVPQRRHRRRRRPRAPRSRT